MAPVTIKGYVDAQYVDHHLEPCWCLKVTLYPGPYWSEWPAPPPMAIVSTGPSWQSRVMSGSVTVLKKGLWLLYNQRHCRCLRSGQLPGTILLSKGHLAPKALHWCLWPELLTKGQKDLWLLDHQFWSCWSWGTCHFRGHANLRDRDYTGDHGIDQTRVAAENHVWVCGSTTAKICVSFHGSCYYGRQWRCPGSGTIHYLGPCWCLSVMLLLEPCWSGRPAFPPGAMLMSRPNCGWGPRLDLWPYQIQGLVEVCGSCYHRRTSDCPECHKDSWFLELYLKQCWSPGTMLLVDSYWSERPVVLP